MNDETEEIGEKLKGWKKSNEVALVYPSRLLREKSLKRVFKGLLLFLMFVEDVLVLFEILFIA